MKTHIQKWGNSLALRIPKSFAVEARLRQDEPVDLSLVEGKLVVTPVERAIQLDDLLASIAPENLHGEVDSGPAMGREVW